jgi:PRTRC genetic system protein E
MLFKSLQDLSRSTQIVCIISSDPDGSMKVTVMPKPAKDGENPALSTPLQLVGTPEELDAQFAEVLTSYTATRTSLAESLAASQTVMEAAKKDATEKAAKAASAKTSTPAARVAAPRTESVSDEDTDAEESGEPAAKVANSDIELF